MTHGAVHTQKKRFKFESWMLGALIVPVGITIAVVSFLKRDSVDLGGECSDREQCRAPSDACLSVGQRSVCTVQCGGACPAGFTCAAVNVTLRNRSGFHDLSGMRYCLPNAMATAPSPR